MNTDFLHKMMTMLEQDEGYRQFPYKCSSGKLTIAIGRNIESKGISKDEALYMLRKDILECWDDMATLFKTEWPKFPVEVQAAVLNMRFQLGFGGLRGFRKMVAALRQFDYKTAANEAKDSNWYKQTPARAMRVVGLIEKAK